VVIPVLILVALLVGYFILFFDSNLRRGLEYAGTHVNGAEVDVGRVHTSFLHASVEIDNIEVTDKNHPERNVLQVGQMHFKMLWDALLRAKIVIDDASILNIQALTPRRHPGHVLPPPPPTPPDAKKGPGLVDDAEKTVLAQTKKKFSDNFLGDLAGLLQGGGNYQEQLKNMQGNLKSDAKIKELQADLKDKQAKWEAKIKTLPQGPELKQYETRIKALKFDTKNPSQFAKDLQEADKIRKEIGDKVKQIDETSKEVKSEVATYAQAYKDVEKLVQEDLKDLQGKLKLPNVDAKEFSQQLFMAMVEQKLGSLAKYVTLARQYMPAKKSKSEKQAEKAAQITPPKRGTGTTYKFPITTGYPLFWLKHAAISSETDQSEYSGHIRGDIRDVTTDQAFLGRPTIITAKGDFPKQKISGLDAKIIFDHTGDQSKDSMNVKVASFPVSGTTLSNSPDVKLAIASAAGSTETEASLVDEALTVSMKNNFGDIKYDLDAKNGMVKEIVDNVLKGIPTVSMNAEVKGSLSDFDVHINSNLGEELSKGFKKQLQAKIDEAKGQLNKLINDRIGGEKGQLKEQMDKTLGPVTKLLDERQGEANKAVNDVTKAGGNGKNPQKKVEEEGKKLLKQFGF
jgi:uncharacterized protein (TIGR03545 family)